VLWKAYIDFEIAQAKAGAGDQAEPVEEEDGEQEGGDVERVRRLFERLLEKTTHVKVGVGGGDGGGWGSSTEVGMV